MFVAMIRRHRVRGRVDPDRLRGRRAGRRPPRRSTRATHASTVSGSQCAPSPIDLQRRAWRSAAVSARAGVDTVPLPSGPARPTNDRSSSVRWVAAAVRRREQQLRSPENRQWHWWSLPHLPPPPHAPQSSTAEQPSLMSPQSCPCWHCPGVHAGPLPQTLALREPLPPPQV